MKPDDHSFVLCFGLATYRQTESEQPYAHSDFCGPSHMFHFPCGLAFRLWQPIGDAGIVPFAIIGFLTDRLPTSVHDECRIGGIGYIEVE